MICATHRNIPRLIEEGRFREDLYFRICVFPILIPPLRQRPEDIIPLARHFLKARAMEMNRLPVPELSSLSLERLMQYAWPGNVRELENLMERALILHDRGDLEVRPQAVFPPDPKGGPAPAKPSGSGPFKTLDEVNAGYIRYVMKAVCGRVEGEGGAARILDIHPSTLRKRMQKLGIPYGRNAGLKAR